MLRSTLALSLVCGALTALLFAMPSAAEDGEKKVVNYKEAKSPLDFTMTNIEGEEVPLSKYKGKVILMVNVASKCGYTPQYTGLQKLYKDYKDKGLVVLGFPCNDFGRQEPGSNEEIQEFCSSKFSVTFPLFSKVQVQGRRAAPLYRYLTHPDLNPKFSGPIPWNFNKFLIDRDGNVCGRFLHKIAPDDKEFLAAVETELKKKKGAPKVTAGS